jgi:4'-phosphopantetheinyl transferase
MTIRANQSVFNPLNTYECHLEDTQVDVWQFSLLQTPKDYESVLNKDERARADRFYFPIHKKRHIAAHTTLRRIISRYLPISAKEIKFDYNEHGKPSVHGHAELQFNLSHSRDTALLAVGKHKPLGIDLEFFSARPYEGIGGHIFSEDENNELQQLNNHLKPLGFFHLWAQKEALIKACGLGLSYPTKQLTLPLLPPTNQDVYDTLHKTHWHVVSFMPSVECCAAVCYDPSISKLRYHTLSDINQL